MKAYLNKAMGRFVMIIGLINFILFMVGAISLGQEIELPNDPLAGRRVFVEKGCVKCHSIFSKGGKVGRDLGKTLIEQGPTGIFAMMWNHSPEMSKLMQKPKKMPIFSEQEMSDLIAYFYFLGYLDEEGEAEKGRMVLKHKQCLACHKVGGEGGKVGPPLDMLRSYANPLSLAQRIWRYGIRMSAVMSILGVHRPEFTGSEIVDLFAYLREISAYKTDVFTYLTPGRPTVGKRLFEEKGCAQCHKIGNNKGKAAIPDLTRVDFHGGATQIAGRMWKHGPKILAKMEEREIAPPIFEENEMADLVAYLYFLNFIEQSGDLETGKRLFTRKRCVKCHSIRGDGGNAGPDLALSDRTGNYIKITTAMWNHNEKMRILMDKMGVPMPRFNEKEMKDLFFYLSIDRMKYEQ
jgi:mono/diheme cytochrome c family protein